MSLSFIGVQEGLLILIAILIIVAVGNYSRNTRLGYWGSVLVAILGSPLLAFIVIFILRNRKPT